MFEMNRLHNNQCDKHSIAFRTAKLLLTLANSAKELQNSDTSRIWPLLCAVNLTRNQIHTVLCARFLLYF